MRIFGFGQDEVDAEQARDDEWMKEQQNEAAREAAAAQTIPGPPMEPESPSVPQVLVTDPDSDPSAIPAQVPAATVSYPGVPEQIIVKEIKTGKPVAGAAATLEVYNPRMGKPEETYAWDILAKVYTGVDGKGNVALPDQARATGAMVRWTVKSPRKVYKTASVAIATPGGGYVTEVLVERVPNMAGLLIALAVVAVASAGIYALAKK